MSYQNNGNGFVKGILLGGILGGAAALLSAPKSGQELRDEISDTCCGIKDKACDLTEQFKRTSHQVMDTFGVHAQRDEHEPYSFLTGSALGAVLGATAAFILAPKSGAKLRKELGSKYDEIRGKAEEFVSQVNAKGHDAIENMEDWKNTVVNILGKISDKKRRSGHSKMDEVVEWAGLGLSLLQQLQKRR